MVKPLSRKETALVNQYLKLIVNKKFTDARGKLERLSQTMIDKEWSKGYYNALQGMSIALKSRNSRYAYIRQLDPYDLKKVKSVRKAFLEQSRDPLQSDFDKGFFTAWSDYLKLFKNNLSKKRASEDTSLLKN
jgi:hypothetical protein